MLLNSSHRLGFRSNFSASGLQAAVQDPEPSLLAVGRLGWTKSNNIRTETCCL